jgi:hypothetical protein
MPITPGENLYLCILNDASLVSLYIHSICPGTDFHTKETRRCTHPPPNHRKEETAVQVVPKGGKGHEEIFRGL